MTTLPVAANSNMCFSFNVDDYVVYPTHGVGRVVAVEEEIIAGHKIELIVIYFEQERMTLRVPTFKITSSGMRPLAGTDTVESALDILKGRARVRRIMWSRRAQEYEGKINSGDLIAIAEVVRDLHKGSSSAEQSYSERQLYEMALERLTREVAVITSLEKGQARQRVSEYLEKKAA